MAKEMIIKGRLLALYLKKLKVGKYEFLTALNEGDVVSGRDADGRVFVQTLDSFLTHDELFGKRVGLNFDVARKFIHLIGAKDAIKLIDWEAMGIEKPNFNIPDDRIARLLVAIGKIRNQNAHKSYAI